MNIVIGEYQVKNSIGKYTISTKNILLGMLQKFGMFEFLFIYTN